MFIAAIGRSVALLCTCAFSVRSNWMNHDEPRVHGKQGVGPVNAKTTEDHLATVSGGDHFAVKAAPFQQANAAICANSRPCASQCAVSRYLPESLWPMVEHQVMAALKGQKNSALVQMPMPAFCCASWLTCAGAAGE